LNQVGAALLIGGIVGLGIGFTLAPQQAINRLASEQQDLLCLEERTELMGEVREALERMEAAGCEPQPKLPTQPVADLGAMPRRVDAGEMTIVAPDAAPPSSPSSSPTSSPSSSPSSSPTSSPTSSPSSSPTAAAWMVQLIATPDPSEAGAVERKARSLGLATRIVLEQVADQSRNLYKVRVGPFSDKAGGIEALRRVKSVLKIVGWLHRIDAPVPDE
jgi:cell division septation protein DedD